MFTIVIIGGSDNKHLKHLAPVPKVHGSNLAMTVVKNVGNCNTSGTLLTNTFITFNLMTVPKQEHLLPLCLQSSSCYGGV